MINVMVECVCDRCEAKATSQVSWYLLLNERAREHDLAPDGWEMIRRGCGRLMCPACAEKERKEHGQ